MCILFLPGCQVTEMGTPKRTVVASRQGPPRALHFAYAVLEVCAWMGFFLKDACLTMWGSRDAEAPSPQAKGRVRIRCASCTLCAWLFAEMLWGCVVCHLLLVCPAQGEECVGETRVLRLFWRLHFLVGPSGKGRTASLAQAAASACLWLGPCQVMLSPCYSFSRGLAGGHMMSVFDFCIWLGSACI